MTTQNEIYPYNLLAAIKGEPFEAVLTEDQINGLEYALSRLKEQEREAVLLRYRDGQTLVSIDAKLGAKGRGRTMIEKALRKFRHPTLCRCIFYGLEFAQQHNRVREKAAELERCKIELMREQILLERAAKKLDASKKIATESINFFSGVNISELGLPARADIHIGRAGIYNVAQLMEMSCDDLRKLPGIGEKSVDQIVERVLQFTGYDIREN